MRRYPDGIEPALDIENATALEAYLKRSGRVAPDESLEIRVLAGGVSNRTVLVRRASGEAWVLKQALEKLRVALDWFSSPERVHREALGLRVCAGLAPGCVPGFVFEDFAQHVIGMQAVPEPFDNWKTVLLAGRLEFDHVAQFGRLLGTIHRASKGEAELSSLFEDRSFFESLRLEPYYAFAAAQVPEAANFLRALCEDTRSRREALVHGDYSPKNVLVHAGRLVLLDFEVVHYGEPAFDVGFSMTHLLSKAHHLPEHRARFARAALEHWRAYTDALEDATWANALEPRAVRHTLACLLARVAGRSPLEYLGQAERDRQRNAVIPLMLESPATINELVERFVAGIS